MSVTQVALHEAAKAVAHPLRAAILGALAGEALSPNVLARRLDEPLGNVSYHVTVLRDLGAIELVDTAPRRGAIEHFYQARWRVRVDVETLAQTPERSKS